MKMNKLAGICVIIPVLLSGCGNQPSAQSAAAAVSTGQPAQQQSQDQGQNQGQNQSQNQAAASGQSGQNRPMMSQQQRQMFMTFQTLLMMDKADGLAITKEQAQTMLPTAQDIVAKGELNDDSKAKLLEKLTDTQKKYVEDAATRMNNRGNGNGNGNGNRSGSGNKNADGGDAGKNPDPSAKPQAPQDQGNAQGQQPTGQGQGAPNGQGAARNGNGNRPDPGKQLIELLQSKVQ